MDNRIERLQGLMLGHAALVMMVGMLAGFGLTFSLLEGIEIWPFPAIEVRIPGSPRGWVAAHTGCIMNGLMVLGIGLALPRLPFRGRSATIVAWGLIYTAWGNTIFYVFANLAPNRGLTVGANKFGEQTAAGVIAVVPALIAATVVLIVLGMTARAAFRLGTQPAPAGDTPAGS